MALTDVSVVPVASKNTVRGEIPEERGMLARRVKAPLLPVQLAAAGVAGALVGVLTATVVDSWVVPPGPVQERL